MTDTQHDNNVSTNRRNALKALAAATGAAGIAALPTRWSKPVMMVGAVPAHAQASAMYCSGNLSLDNADATIVQAVCVTVSPPVAGIQMNLDVIVTGTPDQFSPDEASLETGNPYVTDANGMICTPVVTYEANAGNDSVQFVWSFVNPADGSGTCTTLWYGNFTF